MKQYISSVIGLFFHLLLIFINFLKIKIGLFLNKKLIGKNTNAFTFILNFEVYIPSFQSNLYTSF